MLMIDQSSGAAWVIAGSALVVHRLASTKPKLFKTTSVRSILIATFCASKTLFFHRIGGEQTFADYAKRSMLYQQSGHL